jgi:hypothetical protein
LTISSTEINQKIAGRADDVRTIVEIYYQALLPAFDATLAVVCCMALQGRTLPLSLIFEGYSGYGKTATLQALLGEALSWIIYRSDKFSPSSFVSHAMNVKRHELQNVDLLPKVHSKVLVTKGWCPGVRCRRRGSLSTTLVVIGEFSAKTTP